jgi:hypothetical protein
VKKKEIDTLLDQDIEQHLATLIERAGTEAVRTKLRNLNETCRHLSSTGRLTVPNVVKTYKKLFDDEAIGESTIRTSGTAKTSITCCTASGRTSRPRRSRLPSEKFRRLMPA